MEQKIEPAILLGVGFAFGEYSGTTIRIHAFILC